jgi:hypothetical protein
MEKHACHGGKDNDMNILLVFILLFRKNEENSRYNRRK